MFEQARTVLTHSRATLISDALGVAVIFGSLFAGLNIVY